MGGGASPTPRSGPGPGPGPARLARSESAGGGPSEAGSSTRMDSDGLGLTYGSRRRARPAAARSRGGAIRVSPSLSRPGRRGRGAFVSLTGLGGPGTRQGDAAGGPGHGPVRGPGHGQPVAAPRPCAEAPTPRRPRPAVRFRPVGSESLALGTRMPPLRDSDPL